VTALAECGYYCECGNARRRGNEVCETCEDLDGKYITEQLIVQALQEAQGVVEIDYLVQATGFNRRTIDRWMPYIVQKGRVRKLLRSGQKTLYFLKERGYGDDKDDDVE
jgi:hypothetical protein